MPPADAQKVRIGIADFESRMSELIHEIYDAVLQVNAGQAQNERGDGVEEGTGTGRELALDPNAIVDGFQNLVVGSEAGRVLRLSALVKLGHLKCRDLIRVSHYTDIGNIMCD
jgi:hypothetical protein